MVSFILRLRSNLLKECHHQFHSPIFLNLQPYQSFKVNVCLLNILQMVLKA